MDFSFTEEQNLLRDSVRKFVEKSYTWDKRRSLLESEAGFSRENWASFAELGWTALPFSEADGGIGGKAVDTMIVLEELGKGLVLEPFGERGHDRIGLVVLFDAEHRLARSG